jgi:hypothetical protein
MIQEQNENFQKYLGRIENGLLAMKNTIKISFGIPAGAGSA